MSQLDLFPRGETTCMIPGPIGPLESLIYTNESSHKVAVICHPHPLFQGTMNNKVVHSLSRVFHHAGMTAIRFNYRGVGKSAGTFGDSVGEIDDLLAVLAWVKHQCPSVEFYLAGFSFGAYIAAVGATRENCMQLVSVAPAVTHQPYLTLPPVACPWLVVQGEEDTVISPSAVYEWFHRVEHYHADIHLLKLPQTSHFFDGQLTTLRDLVKNNLVK